MNYKVTVHWNPLPAGVLIHVETDSREAARDFTESLTREDIQKWAGVEGTFWVDSVEEFKSLPGLCMFDSEPSGRTRQ